LATTVPKLGKLSVYLIPPPDAFESPSKTETETLVNEEKPAGPYEINWNAAKLSSGVFFY